MPYFLQRIQRHARGAIIITDPERPYDSERDTVMCAHCQKHWIPEPGSGRERGWCLRCNGPTCGQQVCNEHCIPWEKRIEVMEGKHRQDRNLIQLLKHWH